MIIFCDYHAKDFEITETKNQERPPKDINIADPGCKFCGSCTHKHGYRRRWVNHCGKTMHGNADDMYEHDKTGAVKLKKDGEPKAKTSHSLNPVPCIIFDPCYGVRVFQRSQYRSWDLFHPSYAYELPGI